MLKQIINCFNNIIMKKILLVEDTESFVKSINEILSVDYEILNAINGFEALKQIENDRPDLILLDLNLNGMNGIEFLKNLNEKYGQGSIPVLVTTNMSDDDKIAEAVVLGVRGYVVKSDSSLDSIKSQVDSILV